MFSSTLRRVALRGNAVGASPSRVVAAAGATTHGQQQQQVRYLNLHEYQSAKIMEEAGVNVPFGIAAHSVEEAIAAAKTIGDEEVVIKSQILAGGRGLGHFITGNKLQGGVHIIKTIDVEKYATDMIGGTLVTKQSGEQGKPVNTVLLAKKMQLEREFYFAIMMDRESQGPMIIACSQGTYL
jgi:succinyl-CoA synthetase beta subunit